jgi:MFS family permease
MCFTLNLLYIKILYIDRKENPIIEKPVSRWILLTIMFGPFLSMLDSGIVNVGLPSMAAEFHTTPGGIQWVASVYLLAISALLPLLGSLADQIGRKRIFNLGFLVLSVFSLLSTWAPNLPVLVLSRILQGLGGAMIIANGMALATEHHPASQRGRSLGLLTTMGAVGSIVGPVVGGLLIGTMIPAQAVVFDRPGQNVPPATVKLPPAGPDSLTDRNYDPGASRGFRPTRAECAAGDGEIATRRS